MGNLKYKHNHTEIGLCVDCSEPVVPGKVRCLKHYNNRLLSDRKYYQEHRLHKLAKVKLLKQKYLKENRCADCGAPKGEQDEGFRCCVNCRANIYWPKGNYAYPTKNSTIQL